MKRIDYIVATVTVVEYDDQGRPIGEQTSSPVKIYRAAVPDVWGVLAAQVETPNDPVRVAEKQTDPDK